MGFLLDVWSGINLFSLSPLFSNNQQRRDLEEFLARAAEDGDSEALGFSTLFKVGKTIFDIGKSFFGGGFVSPLYIQKMACVDGDVYN